MMATESRYLTREELLNASDGGCASEGRPTHVSAPPKLQAAVESVQDVVNTLNRPDVQAVLHAAQKVRPAVQERLPRSPWNFGDGDPGVIVT
jgi:hypothetical protein